jgi:hypothetical protein
MVNVLRDRKAIAGFDAMGYDRDQVVAAMAGFIRTFFDGYAASQGKRRWAEKTPNYVDCLPELWELFPKAQFLVILRHGLDVAISMADPHRHYPAIDEYMPGADGNALIAGGLFWTDKSQKIERFCAAHRDACFRLRYEDLTNDPESTLKPTFEFLNERWEPDVIDYTRFTHHDGFGDADVRRRRGIVANSGRYKALSPELQKALREVCGPMLTRLGYE